MANSDVRASILKLSRGNSAFQQFPFTEMLASRAAPKRIALDEN